MSSSTQEHQYHCHRNCLRFFPVQKASGIRNNNILFIKPELVTGLYWMYCANNSNKTSTGMCVQLIWRTGKPFRKMHHHRCSTIHTRFLLNWFLTAAAAAAVVCEQIETSNWLQCQLNVCTEWGPFNTIILYRSLTRTETVIPSTMRERHPRACRVHSHTCTSVTQIELCWNNNVATQRRHKCRVC